MNSKLLVEKYLLNEDNSNLISNLTTAFMDKSDIEIKKTYTKPFNFKKEIMNIIGKSDIPQSSKMKYYANIGTLNDWDKLMGFIWSIIVPKTSVINHGHSAEIQNNYAFKKYKYGK